jgi:EAL domain-containing protein (putative c-di-GMP-specific phosphodiesterase class I)/GGDEF domain-containing protein
MSMFRQLWLAVLVSTLVALTGSLLASMLSARSYLESQLSIKNTDNANALALSLSHSKSDEIMIELAVASLFDSGHYEVIKIDNPQGQTVVNRVSVDADLGAPIWFVRLFPIHAQAGKAKISNGWTQLGVVTLESQSKFAYAALWKSTTEMAVALVIAGLIGGVMSTLVLRRLQRPLNAVIDQAQAITERRFVTMQEPEVPELQKLSRAMNVTVIRLKSMFEDEAQRLDVVRREANCDALTGLANRNYFLATLRDTFQAERSSGGAVFIARIANLASANQQLGRQVTDDLIRAFGRGVFDCASQHPGALAARLNGADFAMLVPNMHSPNELANVLLQSLTNEAGVFVKDLPTTWLSCGSFPRGMESDAILSQLDAALASVEANGFNGLSVVDVSESEDLPKSAEEWTRIIRQALAHKWVRLVSFPVVSLVGDLMHRECPLRLMFDQHGEWQPAGKFLPVAERLRLTPALDLAAVALGLDELDSNPNLKGLAINLSASSVHSSEFRFDLLRILKRRPSKTRLWLEVSEAGAFAHFESFTILCTHLRAEGCKVGLEHFGRQFSEIGKLHGLGLDYIKVDGSFIRGLDHNAGNQSFLKGLSTIAHSIGIAVIAEGVTQTADLAAIKAAGFDGATGPAIRDVSAKS